MTELPVRSRSSATPVCDGNRWDGYRLAEVISWSVRRPSAARPGPR